VKQMQSEMDRRAAEAEAWSSAAVTDTADRE
jgi:hypothetical protein